MKTILITIFLASAICCQAQSNTDRIIILEKWKTVATKQLKTDSINIAWLKAQKKTDSLRHILDSIEIKKMKDYIYGVTVTGILKGSANDQDGFIVSYKWRKIAGPFEGFITYPDSAETTVTRLHAGVYEYELTATDDRGAEGKDSVIINVNYPIGSYAYFKRL